jgi:hypothetical protein
MMHLLGSIIGFVFWIGVAIIVVAWLARDPSPQGRVFENNFRREARTKARGCLDWSALLFFVLLVWLIWRVWG